MQNQLKPINSSDGQFQDGNPYTGALGTVVTSEWLNGVQSAVQSTQRELLKLLQDSKQDPDSNRDDQLLQAVRNIAWGGNAKPSTLAGYGIAIASQAEAEAGTDNVKAMTPLRVEQALNAAGLSGYAKNIASGSLQTVRPNGLYHVDAGQTSGAPDKSNGMLLTNFLSDKWGNQVYWMWGGATYEQRLENGNWQPWVKLLKTGQQSTLADYGITDGASKTDLQTAVNNLVAGAPGALNTLQELAAALGNDQNFAATITNQLAGKASKATTLAGYGIGDAQTKTQSDARYFQRIARFTSNGQFTVPDGVTRIYVSGCGGGGGGGGSGASSASVMAAGGGGGAGNNVMRQDYPVRPGQVLNIVIGGGGSGGLGGPKNGATGSAGISGTNGGTTAIAEIGLNLAGGTGGGAGNTNGIWANGASPGNGGPGMAPGTIGWSGPTTNMCYPGGLGGNSPFGGGGSTVGWYWAGGVSQTGAGFGSGGGGGFAGSDGGGIAGANGAPGIIFIEW
ncbi:hypothetical protein J9978_17305 [Chromobacterium violaceum]|uniref:glycine-rich domain-containing protein n=1 Tax=Chromobacterium violaceum TaxID=536 RepID=UPI0009D9646A|nr:hypothetical protein [Chromobacterium violaceum]MBP4051240.1 hypothetical protein [Chromobacterium violaceum]OQS26201.1 hypothetical protein B0T41_11210 [Chromobacterium violaceum]